MVTSRRSSRQVLYALSREAITTVTEELGALGSPRSAIQIAPDTPPERLRDMMRGFTRALGVRCQFCHVGEPGTDFLEWDFASDAKPNKGVAREMMRMSWAINHETLPAIDGLANPDREWRVTCWTCHRGETVPATAPAE